MTKLFAVLLALLVTSVLYLYRPHPQTSTTPSPQAEWATFTNTQYGYSFQFPSTWQINQENPTDNPQTQAFVSLFDPATAQTLPGNSLTFSANFGHPNPNIAPVTLEPIHCLSIDHPYCLSQIYQDATPVYHSSTIGQIPVIEDQTTVYFLLNGTVFAIQHQANVGSEAEVKAIRNQILSTFRVIN